MKLVVEHYNKLLPSLGLYAGDDNIIRMGGGELGKLAEFKVDGREVYLPTDEALTTSTFKEKVAFHPLAENVLKKRSHVLTAIQSSLQTRLFTVGYLLIESLLGAASAQKNGSLKTNAPDLLKFMSGLEDVTDDTSRFFSSLADRMKTNPSHTLFNVYLKHGGQIKGEKYLRICAISSPLVKALEDAQVRGAAKSGSIEVWGVTPKRKMDVGVLLRVIKTIFPFLETDGYTAGSNNKHAPYCDALLQSVQLLNKDIRYATQHLAYVEPCKSAIDYLIVNDDVINEMDNFDVLRNGVLLTTYNDGDGYASDDQRNELVDKVTHSHPVKSYQTQATYQQPTTPELTTIENMKHLVNPIVRIPGTRQPILEIPEEAYRTVPEQRRRYTGFQRELEPEVRGFSHPTQAAAIPQRNQNLRATDLELQLDRALERAQELEDELRGRNSRRGGFADDRDRDRGRDRYGFSSRDRYEDSYDSRREPRRPIPRAAASSSRDRDRGRGRGLDRFGR